MDYLGIYENLSNADYHGDDTALSNSKLSMLARSYYYYEHIMSNPRAQTPALAVGSMAHCAILEPHLFDSTYVVTPKFDKRTKLGKEGHKEFEEANIGKICVEQKDFADVIGMRDSFMGTEIGQAIIASSKKEISFFWRDKATEILCKCRPDIWDEKNDIIMDIKTTDIATLKAFKSSIWKWRYQVQAAFYSDGVEAVTGRKQTFVFCAIEKKPPYDFAFYQLDDEALEMGRAMYNENIEYFCEATMGYAPKRYKKDFQVISL